jgi:hypothetical protein
MFLRSNIVRIAHLPYLEQFLLLEAGWWLVVAWFIRRFIPFKVWSAHLGTPGAETDVVPLSPHQEKQALGIQLALYRGGRVAAALRNCLVLSIAAKLMLRRRRIPCTLYFATTTKHSGDYFYIGSHSWVRCGTLTIGSVSPQLKLILSIGD